MLTPQVAMAEPAATRLATASIGPHEAGRLQALRVVFAAAAAAATDTADGEVLASFDEWKAVAVGEKVSLSDLLTADHDDTAGFHLCVLGGGPDVSLEDQRRVDAWMAQGGAAVTEVLVRGDRVRWRQGRGVVQGNDDRSAELLAALLSFAFHEGELRKLETEVSAELETADRDADLAGLVDATSLARWDHASARARAAALRRIRFVRLEPHLDRGPPRLTPASQRVFGELATQATVAARLVAVDDGIEALEELYGTACERLSELSYFRREMRVELVIVALLALEAVLLVVELARGHGP